ncbi:alpha-1,6-mannosyltransferase, partial [Ascosphaera acerosa]
MTVQLTRRECRFWWMDLNTFIMEPSHAIHSYVLNQLDTLAYRDINAYNPLNITHPPQQLYLDAECASPTGDNQTASINLVLTQDCMGFNLGSFLVRRSAWTDRLLDIWWDPVMYEQRHMNWDRKEASSLEHLYVDQPW